MQFVKRASPSKSEIIVEPELREQTSARMNYLVGSKENWETGIPMYRSLVYRDVWKGIDVEYIGGLDGLSLRVHLKPGASINRFGMDVGAKTSGRNTNGSLIFENGSRCLTVGKPVAWQTIDGKDHPVEVELITFPDGTIGFQLGKYDAKTEVVISPSVHWTGFIGTDGLGNGPVMAVGLGEDESIFIGGYTSTGSFPVSGEVSQPFAGYYDGFVTRLTPDGDEMVWSTCIGASMDDRVTDLFVDADGNICISGTTTSVDFPLSEHPLDHSFNGGTDVFLAKLSSDTGALLYSTYLGGAQDDISTAIQADAQGCLYVTGGTWSPDFPVSDNAYQTELRGTMDAFLTRVSPDGTAIVFSTLIGNSSTFTHTSSREKANDLHVQESGDVLICGQTTASYEDNLQDFPTTGEPFGQETDLHEAFVCSFSADGTILNWSRFLGGDSVDRCNAMDTDQEGNIYLTGYSLSLYRSFPITPGAASSGSDPISYQAFVVKISGDGQELIYGAFLGASSWEDPWGPSDYHPDEAYDIVVDNQGRAVVTGRGGGHDFPLTVDTWTDTIGWTEDIFVTRLSADGSAFEDSMLLGTLSKDTGIAIACGSDGAIVVVGQTSGKSFPSTGEPFSDPPNGFVFKMSADLESLLFSIPVGGGSVMELAADIAVDQEGNVFTLGANNLQSGHPNWIAYYTNLGLGDMFVNKYSPEMTELLFSTLIGGSGWERSVSIEIDNDGCAVIAGETTSSDFPLDQTGVLHPIDGYAREIVAFRLSEDGTGIVNGAFLGSSGNDYCNDMAFAHDGSVWLCGYVNREEGVEPDFPITDNAFDITPANEGWRSGFFARFSPDFSSLDYCSYLCGSEHGEATGVEVGPDGDVYVAGYTDSMDFPTTPDSYWPTVDETFFRSPFVCRFSRDGMTQRFGTYLKSTMLCDAFLLDENGRPFVLGSASDSGFRDTNETPSYDGARIVAVELLPDGSDLASSTTFGGSFGDGVRDAEMDRQGRLHILGETTSPDYPSTTDAWPFTQPEVRPNTGEFEDPCNMYSILDPSTNTLDFSTLFSFPFVTFRKLALSGNNSGYMFGSFASTRIDASDAPPVYDEETGHNRTGYDGYVLYFNGSGLPRKAALPHIAVTDGWETLLILDNMADIQRRAVLRVYEEGEELEPVAFQLEPGEQVVYEIQEGGCGFVESDVHVSAKVSYVHQQDKGIAEFVLDKQTYRHLSFNLPRYQANRLTWMGFALMNPNDVSATVTLNLYETGETDPSEVVTTTMAPDTRIVNLLDRYFGLPIGNMSRVEVTSDEPLQGINICGFKNEHLLFTKAVGRTPPDKQIHLPHIAQPAANWDSLLVLDNTSLNSEGIELHLFGNGVQVVNDYIFLDGKESRVIDLSQYLGLGAECGYLLIHSNSGDLGTTAKLSYRFKYTGATAEFALTENCGTKLAHNLPAYAYDNIDWTGVALQNTTCEEATVTVLAYQGGVVLDQSDFMIPPYGSFSDEISSMFPELNWRDIDRLVMDSTVPLSGLNISGAGHERFLFTPAFYVE